MLSENDFIVIDGLYSWEEYVYLKQKFSYLTLVHVFSEPQNDMKDLPKEVSVRFPWR